jgi:hypothetical protein
VSTDPNGERNRRRLRRQSADVTHGGSVAIASKLFNLIGIQARNEIESASNTQTIHIKEKNSAL